MLTTKQLAKNSFITYCSTSNTLFIHNSKTKPKNISMHTAQYFVKNAAAHQLKKFFALPALYTLRKKT